MNKDFDFFTPWIEKLFLYIMSIFTLIPTSVGFHLHYSNAKMITQNIDYRYTIKILLLLVLQPVC